LCVVNVYSTVGGKGVVMTRKRGAIGAGGDWKKQEGSRLAPEFDRRQHFFFAHTGTCRVVNYIISGLHVILCVVKD